MISVLFVTNYLTHHQSPFCEEMTQFPEVSFAKLSRIVVRAVKWKEKRQSIENTIDAVVLKNYDGKVLVYDEADIDEKLSDYKVGDEVKLAIIKGNE